jgi:hypothetical protein
VSAQIAEDLEVLRADVHWQDDYDTDWLRVQLLLSREPSFGPYSKRAMPDPGGHLYVRWDGPLCSFFYWAGRPDDGFGGWKRDIDLDDGTKETVVGGWHCQSRYVADVGFERVVECTYRTTPYFDGSLNGGALVSITETAFRQIADELLPDMEVVEAPYNILTVKWRGQLSKAEWVERECVRRLKIREELAAKYGDVSVGPKSWYNQSTPEERKLLERKPYSKLGPA